MKKRFFYLILLLLGTGFFFSCEKAFEYKANDIPPFTGLEVPAAGKGYQIHVPPFPVPAQYEREFFIRMEVGNSEDIYVNRFESLCRPGTHHLVVYGYDNENDPQNPPVGVMRDQNLSDGRGNFNLTMGSDAMYYLAQVPEFELALPPGVAIKIPGNATVDMNSHYFNVSDQTQFGEVYFNLHTLPRDSAQEVLVVDLIDNGDELFLPKGETTDIEYTETVEDTTEIWLMFSHMHKRGVQFDAYIVGGDRDGELIYTAYDYQHPPVEIFSTPLVLAPGEGIRTKVRYFNNSNRDIRFGVTSEDEMGILFFMKKEE